MHSYAVMQSPRHHLLIHLLIRLKLKLMLWMCSYYFIKHLFGYFYSFYDYAMLLLLLPTAGGDRISKNANITDKMAVECNNFGSTADARCASSDYWRSFVLLYVCFYYVISTSVYLAIVFFLYVLFMMRTTP